MRPLLQRRYKATLNLVPLIDIVFILLLFFSVSFRADTGISLVLPDATSSEQTKSVLIISITETNDLYLNDRKIETPALLKQALIAQLPQTPQVIVRGHHTLAYQSVIDVMSLIHDSGGRHIILATQPQP